MRTLLLLPATHATIRALQIQMTGVKLRLTQLTLVRVLACHVTPTHEVISMQILAHFLIF